MATAFQQALYKEHQGVDYLSRNAESHVLHQPELLDRLTISQQHFNSYLSRTCRPPKFPWGRSISYAGIGAVNLPENHRPKQEPPIRVQKGHRHFGGGVLPFPRGLPIEQYYDLTLLKRSNLRRNDELIPDPQKLDIGKHVIQLPFPSEHPYHSHISKMAVFPNFDSPDDLRKGKLAVSMYPTLPPTAAASAPDPVVLEKTKGHFDRRELVVARKESERKSLTWNGHNFYQIVKGPNQQRQLYYPTPPSSVHPNHNDRPPEMTVAPRTANALYNLQKSYWQTIYNNQYTGNGPQNVLKLDNYDDFYRGEGDVLKEHFTNKFIPPHPLEGRHSEVRVPVKQKKKKRIIVNGKEVWVTDNEEEAANIGAPQYNNTRWSAAQDTSADAENIKPEIEREPGSYSKNAHHLINHENSEFEQDVTKCPGTYYHGAHPYQAPSMLHVQNTGSSYYNTAGVRPATAPEPSRPRSPTIHNMPSQLHEETKTGSTNSDLYPKWFRKTSSVYGPKRPSTALLDLQNSWNKTDVHRRFHQQFSEDAPDIRQKPDLRITTNERRHIVPETGIHVYYYHR